VLRSRAECYYRLGNYPAAIKDYTARLAVHPYDLHILHDRVEAYLKLGDKKAAEQDIAEMHKREPYSIDMAIPGMADHRGHSSEHYVAALDRISSTYPPGDWRGIEKRAILEMKYGKCKECAADIDRILPKVDIPIRRATLFLDQALCYSILDKFEPALGAAGEAIAIWKTRKESPGNWEEVSIENAYLLRAALNVRLNRYDSALADCSELVKEFPLRSLGYTKRADMYVRLKESQKALADFAKVIEYDPENEHAILTSAQLCEDDGHFDKAAMFYSNLISMHPDIPDFYLARARTYKKWGQTTLALRDYGRVLELDKDDPMALEERARIKASLGKIEDACRDYDRAIKSSPEDATRLGSERTKLIEKNKAALSKPGLNGR
jgi:tetratricopeptide (TPR) repeat protein